ncbi:unnamed protein product [Heterotrigona itama]|uniref:SoHo domain-containing protein n=1 Tax=Heterotrigona itama TaxID=395501 RepID=A0A6V7HAJ5_9HYME|nr:unnamed protein product [Heterotrigona itama]
MPHGARNRRNRKGRNNRRRVQRQRTPGRATSDNETTVESPERIDVEEEEEEEEKDEEETNNSGNLDVHRRDETDDQPRSIENNERNATVDVDEGAIASNEMPSHNRRSQEKCRIEMGTVQPGIKVMKITTISSSPLEAKIDHIAGVGIVETGSKIEITKNEAIVTISEPVDPFSRVTTRADKKKSDSNEECSLAGSNERLQIRDVSDCDTVETDHVRPVIVEMESDVEKERTWTELTARAGFQPDFDESDPSTQAPAEARHAWDSVMPREVERKLRSFIEGLKLPTYAEDVEESARATTGRGRISGSARKKSERRKRAAFEAQHAHCQAANRFLDIIQEEGEKLSEDEEQHIRDFINEEIGKYRRERHSSNFEQTTVKINVIDVDEEMPGRKEDDERGTVKPDEAETECESKETREESRLIGEEDSREENLNLKESDDTRESEREGEENVNVKDGVAVEDESVEGSGSFKIEELEGSIEEGASERKDDNVGEIEEVESEILITLSGDSANRSDSELNMEGETNGQILAEDASQVQLDESRTDAVESREASQEKVALVRDDASAEKQSEISESSNVGERCTIIEIRENGEEKLESEESQDSSDVMSEEVKVEQLGTNAESKTSTSGTLIEETAREEKLDLGNSEAIENGEKSAEISGESSRASEIKPVKVNEESETKSEEIDRDEQLDENEMKSAKVEEKSLHGNETKSRETKEELSLENETKSAELIEETGTESTKVNKELLQENETKCVGGESAKIDEEKEAKPTVVNGESWEERETSKPTESKEESLQERETKSAKVDEESLRGKEAKPTVPVLDGDSPEAKETKSETKVEEESSRQVKSAQEIKTKPTEASRGSSRENEAKSAEASEESSGSRRLSAETVRTERFAKPTDINISESRVTKFVSTESSTTRSYSTESKHSKIVSRVNGVDRSTKERSRPPTPPKRSSSLSSIDLQDKTIYSRVHDDPSACPLRRRKEAKETTDVENPPTRPPLPKENIAATDASSFAQPRSVHPSQARTTIGSLGTLLTLISGSDATVENIRDALRNVDQPALALPENAREIIDDLRADGRCACSESDSIELRNCVENGVDLGNGATPEITRDHLARRETREKSPVSKSSGKSVARVPIERIVKVVMEPSEDPGEDRPTVSKSGKIRGTSTGEEKIGPRQALRHVREKVIKSEASTTLSTRTVETEERTPSPGGKVESSKDARELTTSEQEFEEIYKCSTLGDRDRKERGKCESPSEILDAILNMQRGHSTDKEKLETDYHDSSSSATTLSTVMYSPMDAWQADIYSIIAEEARKSKLKRQAEREVESSSLRSKLPFLKADFESLHDEVPVTPEPIPYSPVEDLYYVPVESRTNYANDRSREDETVSGPGSLKDLCIKRILSMPYGLHVINEITVPEFDVFRSLRSIPVFANNVTSDEIRGVPLNTHGVNERQAERARLTTASPGSKRPDAREIAVSDQGKSERLEQRPRRQTSMASDSSGTWVGLSTTKDPRLLVCLSPSQQKTAIKTSADDLLDLHKKFLNRHSYFDEEPPRRVPVPKYRVELLPIGESKERDRKHDGKSTTTSRLLEIIKENSDSSKRSRSTRLPKSKNEARVKFDETSRSDSRSSHARSNTFDKGRERLKVTRLCDWLNLARGEEPVDDTLSDDLLIEPSVERREFDKRRFSGRIRGSERADVTKQPAAEQKIGGERATPVHFISAASPPDRPEPPVRSSTPFNKSPLITLNSAIIDKSITATPDTAGKRTPPTRRAVDHSRYNVNPALIDDRVEVPPRVKRVVNVDKSCIDTTSIFDQNPPRSHLQPRRYKNNEVEENAKHVAATEIMQNLKKLQTETEDQLEGLGKYSLSQEYFAQQLRYIELLENQLKNVILAEEEEKEAFEEFQNHVRGERERAGAAKDEPKRKPVDPDKPFDRAGGNVSGDRSKDDDSRVESQSWQERSENVESDRSETIDKHGRRDFSRKVRHENGLREEESCEEIEHVEQHSVITKRGEKVAEKMRQESGSRGKSSAGDKTTAKDERRSRKENTSSQVSDARKAVEAKEKSNASAVVVNGEAFRRKMYDEYVHKVLEREERKHHKVVKISTREDIQRASNKLAKSGMSAVEREFIEKARNRLNKFGIKLDESEPDNESDKGGDVTVGKSERKTTNDRMQETEKNMVKAKCLIDGKQLEDANKLPKHLQEFLKMSATFDDGESHRESRIAVLPRRCFPFAAQLRRIVSRVLTAWIWILRETNGVPDIGYI